MSPGKVSVGDDTIVGIATPPGTSALGLIRVSGAEAIAVASAVVRLRESSGPHGLAVWAPRTLRLATIVDPNTDVELDTALVAIMPGPGSYTGEDVVEISCHGNPVLLGEVMRHLASSGARLAEPGEFTRRAYLNGRIDLVQAEAVAELIRARTARAVQLAARQVRGMLSIEINALRDRLLGMRAGLEVALDFPDDGVGLTCADASSEAADLLRSLDRLLESAYRGRAVQDGLTVVLVGAQNAGKSSLFNRLLGSDRAIVAPSPGTTRDLVEGTVVIRGVPVRLVDGAGLGTPADGVDAEGMRRLRTALGGSDLALVVLDKSRPLSAADREVLDLTVTGERLVVANKCDLPDARHVDGEECSCSALTGNGVASLAGLLERWVAQRTRVDGDEGGIVASLRVLDKLEAARESMRRVSNMLGREPMEVVLVDLERTQHEIDNILGVEVGEDVLDRIFSSFCVGK
jgi:tRNA modification GTPase